MSPARAQPHDPASWLSVPFDLHELPSIEQLLVPTEPVETYEAGLSRADLAALEALVAPSPARAAPHDAAAWLPLTPELHDLPDVADLAGAPVPAPREPVTEIAPAPARRSRPTHAAAWSVLPSPRVLLAALVATAAVLAGAGGAGVLGGRASADVIVRVDGRVVSARSDARTVRGLLRDRKIVLASGDKVVPSLGSSLTDDLRVRVLRAFPVVVDTDGIVATVPTTERSAERLAATLGPKSLVVRNRPGRLAAGATVVLRSRMRGTIVVDGSELPFDSPSLTVAELLDAYHVVLVGEDHAVPALETRLTPGVQVTVVRVGHETVQETVPVEPDAEMVADPNLPIGQSRLVQEGKLGAMVVTSLIKRENGVEASRTVVSRVPSPAPVPRIVAYGTQADWHWDALANCESGGRWDTVDPATGAQYDGGLGIYRPTWRAFGGQEFASNAGLATREQQIIVGQRIYSAHGWGAWGCSRTLHWI